MIIRCPECQFERSIDSSKIPSSAAIATCPKCRHRFRFRDLAPGMADAAGGASDAPAAPAASRVHPAIADTPHPQEHKPDGPNGQATLPKQADAMPGAPFDHPDAQDADDDLPATFRRPSFENSSGQNSSGQNPYGQHPSGQADSTAQAPDAAAFDGNYNGEDDHVGEPRPISAADDAPSPSGGPSTPDMPDAPDAPRAPVAQQPSHGHTDLSRPGDDPLPPGAVIPGRGSSPARDDDRNGQPGHENGRGNEPRRPGSPRDIWDAVASVGDRWRKQPGRESRPGDAGDDAPHSLQDGRGDGMLPPHASGPERDRRDTRHPGERDAPLPPWAASARNEVPWENLDRLGFFPGLYQTILRVMLAAPRFFSGVRSTGSLKRPVAFYLLVGIFQSLTERLWYLMSMRAFGGFIEDPQLKAWMGSVTHDMSLPMTLLLSPFTLLLQLAVLAGLYHFMIRLVEPRAADLPTTVRVISYSAAPTVLSVVPLVGPVVGSLWFVVCTFVGVKYAHRLPWSRTALAIGPLLGLGFALTVQLLRMFMSSAPM